MPWCDITQRRWPDTRFVLAGTGVLATHIHIYLDRVVDTPYSANACWGFDEGVGMTWFDITKLHGTKDENVGSVLEVDFYHAASLVLVMNDDSIIEKVKQDLDTMLGDSCRKAKVLDAAVVRLPQAVNWYCPGSYRDLPDLRSQSVNNAYFVGDLVRSCEHGSWSQEKAYVTGIEAANVILGKPIDTNIIPLAPDEPHVALGRTVLSTFKSVLGAGDPTLHRRS